MLSKQCRCSGPCRCYLPQATCIKPIASPSRIDPNIIATMLVQTLACGNSDLAAHLTKLAPIIVRRNGFCSDELFYVSAQIELVDQAMLFARNYVDYSDSRSTSKGFQQARSRSESESKAQSTSQASSCGFSDASSFNQFNRDSYDRSRSQSTTDSNSEGFSDSNTYDRSLQQANGISQVWDTARSESTGDGEGQHDEETRSSGASYSRTNLDGPDGRVNDIDAGNASLTNIAQLIGDAFDIFWTAEVYGGYTWDPEGGEYEFNFDNFEQPGIYGADITNFITDTIDDNYTDPGPQNITGDNIPSLLCCCDNRFFEQWIVSCEDLGLPPGSCHWYNESVHRTYGQRYSVDYNLNIGFEAIKKGLSVNLSWGRASDFNQSHVITKACTGSTSQSDTSNFYDQLDWSRAHGESYTRDESSTQRDYHVRSDSERTAHSRTDAGSASTGDAESESESGAERTSHNEAHGASQGTNWSKSRSRSNSLSTSDSKSNSIAENLSDIFTALSKMYDILVEQRQVYRTRFRARQGAAVGLIENCKYAIPADPITSSMLRSVAACWENQFCNNNQDSGFQTSINCG